MDDAVRAFAPATVSNLCCAFDVMGCALETPGDIVTARRRSSPGIALTRIDGDRGRLPRDPRLNTAGVAAQALLDHLAAPAGVELQLDKGMPLGSGLGSSAASAAAALMAINHLLGSPLSPAQLVPFALEAERAACGTGHADNAAPSLLGGLVLIRSTDPLDLVSLPLSGELHCALACPELEVRTEDARQALPRQVPLEKAVTQWGNVAGLTAGLILGDDRLIARSLQDVLIEPRRRHLVPGFESARAAALARGALGAGLSGSGPTVFALCRAPDRAQQVAQAMVAAFREAGIDADGRVSPLSPQGARIL